MNQNSQRVSSSRLYLEAGMIPASRDDDVVLAGNER
jgi:hypothetical protein